MRYPLSFEVLHEYDPRTDGITVPVVLGVGRRDLRIVAKVDTGAAVCVFEREHGEDLGLDIEAGQPLQIATASGSFLAYGHDVSLSTFGFQFDVVAYFAFQYGFPRNVLGRRGWLEQVRLGIVDYDRKLYVSRYSDGNQ